MLAREMWKINSCAQKWMRGWNRNGGDKGGDNSYSTMEEELCI